MLALAIPFFRTTIQRLKYCWCYVYIFIDDAACLEKVVHFLVSCLQLRSTVSVIKEERAIQYTLKDISYPFDFVKATRKDRPISLCVEPYLAYYLKTGHRANLPLSGLAATISSALFMDHYIPEMLIFRTLYRSVIIIAYRRSKALWPDVCPAKETDLVEFHFSRLYKRFSENVVSSANLRKEELKSFSGQLYYMRSNRICLIYSVRPLYLGFRKPYPRARVSVHNQGLSLLPLLEAVSGGYSSTDYKPYNPYYRCVGISTPVFDAALKSAFGERCYIFSATREDPLGPRRSGPKVGVVTTSISRDISTFMIGNFNVAYDSGDKNGLSLDGRLKYNFAGEIRKWRSCLDDSIKSDSHRLDVPLGNAPYAIDAVEAIEDYRDLIILYISSGRMARDTCRGSVRYKGPARIVILALENLYPNRLSYILDCGLIDRFRGLDSLCPLCGCYSRSVTFLARYLEYKTSSKRRWRISGFLESVSCDVIRNPVRGRRRKRESRGSGDIYPRKRILLLNDIEVIGGPDPYRNSRVKFARRSQTLKAKAHKLTKFCDTDIYLVFNHQRGSFIYNSVEDRSWPPNDKQLMKRINFSKIEGLPESPESNLSRLTRYFATRLEHFRLLEDLYRDIDPANIITNKEALQIKSSEYD
ncbi:uncharacterized protein N7525_011126 [Penicillium rubens]|uniref:uncharacterized protein n=1 Tax=Penicillium rubens TaxID=1108849 RepID=UPI002A5A0945|nr:uncharacterized protein N7525_011126 [Penicillium rubens]KAJ5821842.1 hypothetical protein N7525_011126 [Penicillium rubens]